MTNDVWLTTYRGRVLRYLFSEGVVRSVPSPNDVIAAIPDQARGRFWLIRPGQIDLMSFSDGLVATADFPATIQKVVAVEVSRSTGDLFFATNNYVGKINAAGGLDTQAASWVDLSLRSSTGAYGVASDARIFIYNGTGSPTPMFDFGGGETLCSIDVFDLSNKPAAERFLYVFDSNNNAISQLDVGSNVVWSMGDVFSNPPASARLRITRESDFDNRRIYCWSDSSLVVIEDSGAPRKIAEIDFEQSNLPVFGGLSSSYPPFHVWSCINPLSRILDDSSETGGP